MGNRIASSFVGSLRRSLSGTTVYSQTSANEPLFVDPTTLPGVARAWVVFNGLHPAEQECTVYNKSTTVTGVTSKGGGDYKIGFTSKAFTNSDYIVTGSLKCTERRNLTSAANSFFVIDPTYKLGVNLTSTEFRIQTFYSPASAGALYSGPAYADRVSLVIYQ